MNSNNNLFDSIPRTKSNGVPTCPSSITSTNFFTDQPTFRSIGRVAAPPVQLSRSSQDYSFQNNGPFGNNTYPSMMANNGFQKQTVVQQQQYVTPSVCTPTNSSSMSNITSPVRNLWSITLSQLSVIQKHEAAVLSKSHIFLPSADGNNGKTFDTLQSRLTTFVANCDCLRSAKEKINTMSASSTPMLYLSDSVSETTIILSLYLSSGEMAGIIVEGVRYSGCSILYSKLINSLFDFMRSGEQQLLPNRPVSPIIPPLPLPNLSVDVETDDSDCEMVTSISMDITPRCAPAAGNPLTLAKQPSVTIEPSPRAGQQVTVLDMDILDLPARVSVRDNTLLRTIQGYKLLVSIYNQKLINYGRINRNGKILEHVVSTIEGLISASVQTDEVSKDEILLMSLCVELINRKLKGMSIVQASQEDNKFEHNKVKQLLALVRAGKWGNEIRLKSDEAITEISVLF